MRHRKWAATERRKLLKLRIAIDHAKQPQRRLMASMARMLEPDKLQPLDDSLILSRLKPRVGRLDDGVACDNLKLPRCILQHLKEEGILSVGGLCARTASKLYRNCTLAMTRVKIERELHRIRRELKPEPKKIIPRGTPCDSLALSIYSRNVLADSGIKTVGALCALSNSDLYQLDRSPGSGFFRTEIRMELRRIGRSIRG